MPTIQDRLLENARHGLPGRQRELALLLQCLADDSPLVVHVHGMSGIGKTALLRAFAARARDRGVRVISLDCGKIEPTQSGFLHRLSAALSRELRSLAEAAEALRSLDRPVALVLDRYEVLNLLDAWLRQSFVPALPDRARLIIGSRLPPAGHWIMAPEWHGLFLPLRLSPLDEDTARELVAQAGVTGESLRRIVEFAHGHPLALKLASSLASSAQLNGDLPLESVLHHLSRLYLGEIEDAEVRAALRASSFVRRITRPLIDAIMPDVRGSDVMDRLARVPFVEADEGGLSVHEAIREAIAADFEACDPEGFRAARRAAWRCLREAVRQAPGGELWRHTADLIYLLRNPIVRDAFFPRSAAPLAVEPARAEHGEAIRRITRRHEPPDGPRSIEHWWTHSPDAFRVVLEAGGDVAGFYAMFDPDEVPEQVVLGDPLAARWLAHVRENRVPRGQAVLFLRRWLSAADGERPSPVQASAWLDIKRHYMELRPRLRRVYLGLLDPAPYAEVASQLGFEILPGGTPVGGAVYRTAVLDMGPSCVDGWLSWLVGTELGGDSEEILDVRARVLRLEHGNVPLTRLEFEVMRYLRLNEGRAVSRQDLLNDVWGLSFDGGSNVVDTVVAGLRRKLGERAGIIGTVRGYGYVLRETLQSRP